MKPRQMGMTKWQMEVLRHYMTRNVRDDDFERQAWLRLMRLKDRQDSTILWRRMYAKARSQTNAKN